MPFRASHRFARISARKVRPLADMIRGKFADEALDILKYQPQRGARMLEKVLKSALGNAEDRRAPNVSQLVVVDARVDEHEVRAIAVDAVGELGAVGVGDRVNDDVDLVQFVAVRGVGQQQLGHPEHMTGG
jgi:large subunit ribosomal protein L22